MHRQQWDRSQTNGSFGAALLLLSLVGCTAQLPPSAALPDEPELVAIEAAVQSWRHAGLPWSHTCDEQFDQIRVVVSMPDEFTTLCGRRPVNAGGKLYACNTEQYENSFPFWLMDNDRIPLLVISRLQPVSHRHMLVIHESMHWMERCSGKGIDFEHEDERVWQSARLMAQRLLRMNERQYRLALDWGPPAEHYAQAEPDESDAQHPPAASISD